MTANTLLKRHVVDDMRTPLSLREQMHQIHHITTRQFHGPAYKNIRNA
jgi:hypothetical protein